MSIQTIPIASLQGTLGETSLPFGAPFTILCALTLTSLVIGTFASAAALRHGLE